MPQYDYQIPIQCFNNIFKKMLTHASQKSTNVKSRNRQLTYTIYWIDTKRELKQNIIDIVFMFCTLETMVQIQIRTITLVVQLKHFETFLLYDHDNIVIEIVEIYMKTLKI